MRPSRPTALADPLLVGLVKIDLAGRGERNGGRRGDLGARRLLAVRSVAALIGLSGKNLHRPLIGDLEHLALIHGDGIHRIVGTGNGEGPQIRPQAVAIIIHVIGVAATGVKADLPAYHFIDKIPAVHEKS